MAFGCIFFMRVLVFNFGMFRLVNFLTECLCMVSLTLVVMVMRGLVFHPLFCMVLISGSNLVCFCSRASLGNFILTMCTFYGLDYGCRGG